VGLVRRVPGRRVPPGEDLLALRGGQVAEGTAGAAPGGGGVVPQTLEVGLGVGVQSGDTLLGRLGGLELGEQGDFVGLALESAAGGGEPPPGDRAEDSAELAGEFHG
jgi:hypothetical protein